MVSSPDGELLDSRHNHLVPPTRYSMHILPLHWGLELGKHIEVACSSFWLQHVVTIGL